MERKQTSPSTAFNQLPTFNAFTGKYATLSLPRDRHRIAMMQVIEADTHSNYLVCRGYDTDEGRFFLSLNVAKPYGQRGTFPWGVGDVFPAAKPEREIGTTPGVASVTTGQPADLNETIDILTDDAGAAIQWLCLTDYGVTGDIVYGRVVNDTDETTSVNFDNVVKIMGTSPGILLNGVKNAVVDGGQGQWFADNAPCLLIRNELNGTWGVLVNGSARMLYALVDGNTEYNADPVVDGIIPLDGYCELTSPTVINVFQEYFCDNAPVVIKRDNTTKRWICVRNHTATLILAQVNVGAGVESTDTPFAVNNVTALNGVLGTTPATVRNDIKGAWNDDAWVICTYHTTQNAWTAISSETSSIGRGNVEYKFDTTITDSDPTPGYLRFNHATFSSVTEIYIDDLDANGLNVSSWTAKWDGVLVIQSRYNLAGTPAILQVNSATDQTGYWKLGVTPLTADGNPPFADDEDIVLTCDAASGKVRVNSGDDPDYLENQFIVTDTYDSTHDIPIDIDTEAAAGNDKIRPFVDGSDIAGYEAALFRVLVHDGANGWKLVTVADLLKELTGYVLANNQSIGKDAADTPEWQNDGVC